MILEEQWEILLDGREDTGSIEVLERVGFFGTRAGLDLPPL